MRYTDRMCETGSRIYLQGGDAALAGGLSSSPDPDFCELILPACGPRLPPCAKPTDGLTLAGRRRRSKPGPRTRDHGDGVFQ